VGIKSKPKKSIDQPTELPKFSIIIPAKDEEVVIGRCLKAMLDLDYPKEKLEVIVVEGNSKDATKAVCTEFSEQNRGVIKVICEKFSKGKPAALNLALSHISGDIVGVFDADSIPEKDVLKKLVSYFQDNQIVAVQGFTSSLNPNQNMLTRIASLEDRGWFQGLLQGRDKLKLFVPLTGSCQFIRTNVIKEMGGWDEFSLAEDVDLALRLTQKGYPVKFAPDVCSRQETPSNIGGLTAQRTRWYRGYMEATFKYGSLMKHPSLRNLDAEFLLIGPFVMVVCLASYVNWGLSLLFSAETSIFPISAVLVVALTTLTLLSLGLSLVFSVKPVRFRNILWVPFVYFYWFIQMGIATSALLDVVFRRQRVWNKTVKTGLITPFSVFGGLNKLKVCFVSSYPPNRARLSEYAQNLISELANRPAIGKLYLIVDKPVTLQPDVSRVGSKVKVLRVWRADDLLSILNIMRQIIKLRPDIVHFNVHFQSYGRSRLANFTGLSLVFFSRLLGFKVIAEVHNLGEKVNLEKVRLKPSLINKTGILVATKLLLSASSVVVTVRSYAAYLQQRYGHSEVRYIPHGTSAYKLPFVDPEEKTILIFGHMGPYKGLSVMFEAFQELLREHYKVKLVVAGASHPNFPGFLDPYIKMNLPHVEFLGYVPEEDLAQVFREADVVVIPYFTTTGTSGVFHLACGYGRPIVASDLPEIREIISEGASAVLFPVGDAKALKEAILKVFYDGDLAAKMSEQNLVFAEKESWDIVARAYEELYLELLSH